MISTFTRNDNLARDRARHEGYPYYLSLCTECDDECFPQPEGEGFIDVCELRDGIAWRAEPNPDARMIKMALDQFPQPQITITLNGEELPVEDVMELQAGDDGWVVLFRPSEPCRRCGHSDHMKVPVVYGQLSVSLIGKVAV